MPNINAKSVPQKDRAPVKTADGPRPSCSSRVSSSVGLGAVP